MGEVERGREEVGGERRREVLKQNLCGGYFISYFSYYSTLFVKTPGLGESMEAPAARKGPQPYSSPHSELLLGPKDLAGCFHEDLGSRSSAPDSPLAIRAHLRQDDHDASSPSQNAYEKSGILWRWEGTLGTPLGLF